MEPEIQIVGDRVTVRHNGSALVTAPLADVLEAIMRITERPPSCGILPEDVRVWRERADAVAVTVEIKPHARTVYWIADESKANYGPGARYEQYFLAFPFVELLLVFRGGALTGYQQLYYRREPLAAGGELLLPNLLNVAQGYSQRAWVCLANMRDVSRLSWSQKICAVVDHVFNFKFNRSSEVHEGNSYFGAMRDLDPRVASPTAWAAATIENPRFPLEVAWRSAGTTAGAELDRMLDQVVAPPALKTAADLGGLVTQAIRRRGRP